MKTNIRTLLITACVALLCVPYNAQHKITVNDGLKWAESLYGILGIGPSWGRSTSAIDTITLERLTLQQPDLCRVALATAFGLKPQKVHRPAY